MIKRQFGDLAETIWAGDLPPAGRDADRPPAYGASPVWAPAGGARLALTPASDDGGMPFRNGRLPAMTRPASPYLTPGFYDRALAAGRHREITGGWWDETGRIQLSLLQAEGMRADHRLLDIGCGALRLGCRAVPYLDPGNYWGTDASGALMARGYDRELTAKHRLPPAQLIEDAAFAFPGVPATIDFAIAFAVFTHLPADRLAPALTNIRARFPALQHLLFTVFVAPDDHTGPLRQPDGVVTHPDRPPYHRPAGDVLQDARAAGFAATLCDARLPRGQVLCLAQPA